MVEADPGIFAGLAAVPEVAVADMAELDARLRIADKPFVVRGLVKDWPLVEAGRRSSRDARAYLLRHHRGMPIEHQRRAVEWFLLLHEVPIDLAHQYAHAPVPPIPHEETTIDVEDSTPALYDNGLDASEGLWLRPGWAGRG